MKAWLGLIAAGSLMACGPFNAEPGGDDAGAFGPPDLGRPDGGFFVPDTGVNGPDGGVFNCAQFCALAGDCLERQSEGELAVRGASATCATEAAALTECTSTCAAQDPSVPCLDCAAACGSSCTAACGPTSLPQSREALYEGLSCWHGPTRPSETCTSTSSITGYSGSIRPDGPLGTFDRVSYMGPASVVEASPLRLRTTTGDIFVLETEGLAIPTLTASTTVMLSFEAECPWWCETAFVLRTETGALIAAGWSGRRPLEIAEMVVAHAPRACVGAFSNFAYSIDLNLVTRGGSVLVGEVVQIGDFRVANGRSVIYYAIRATDHPGTWMEGLIMPAP